MFSLELLRVKTCFAKLIFPTPVPPEHPLLFLQSQISTSWPRQAVVSTVTVVSSSNPTGEESLSILTHSCKLRTSIVNLREDGSVVIVVPWNLPLIVKGIETLVPTASELGV